MFDFLNKSNSPLAERAKSPLYSSFILTWLIWNWQIIITLFFFKKEDYGKENIVEYINYHYLNMNNCIWIPLLITCVFILIVPWIDYLIVWYSEYNKRVKIDKKIEIGRKHFVEGTQYYNLRLKYEEEKNRIVDIEQELVKSNAETLEIKAELKKVKTEYSTRNSEFRELNKEKNRISAQVTRLAHRHDLSRILFGRWQLTTIREGFGRPTSQEIDVNSNRLYIIDESGSNEACTFEMIDFDSDNKSLNFLKIKGGLRIICRLNIISNDRLEGTEDNVRVIYTRSAYKTDEENEKI